MKRLLFLAVSTLTFIIIIITGCWGPSKRDVSNITISKIEEFRKVKGRLPDSLSEAGAQDGESCPCYCKTATTVISCGMERLWANPTHMIPKRGSGRRAIAPASPNPRRSHRPNDEANGYYEPLFRFRDKLGTDGRMVRMPHIALLGDSIFANAVYTSSGPDVVSQVRRLLPPKWGASLLAVDGSMTGNIPDQVRHLPNDCTHLVLSVGGNNALAEASRLGISFFGMSGEPPAKALDSLADVSSAFESEYRSAVDACLRPKLPLSVCTIYNGCFPE